MFLQAHKLFLFFSLLVSNACVIAMTSNKVLSRFNALVPVDCYKKNEWQQAVRDFLKKGEDVNQPVGAGMSFFEYLVIKGAPVGFVAELIKEHKAEVSLPFLTGLLHESHNPGNDASKECKGGFTGKPSLYEARKASLTWLLSTCGDKDLLQKFTAKCDAKSMSGSTSTPSANKHAGEFFGGAMIVISR